MLVPRPNFLVPAKRPNSVLFSPKIPGSQTFIIQSKSDKLKAHFAGGRCFTAFLKIADLILP